jgi:Ca2+/Na+ antiporter
VPAAIGVTAVAAVTTVPEQLVKAAAGVAASDNSRAVKNRFIAISLFIP